MKIDFENIRSYSYDREKNVMVDEGGFIIFNIFSIITPNILYLFKKEQQNMVVPDINGDLVELVYPYDEE